MLEFFRRYERYFFLVITFTIIISFSFFGTYSSLGTNASKEQFAFQAINGKNVTRNDVDEMTLFLATDMNDKMLFGGVWGPNFLNDGVVRKDFLETGLGAELALAYQEDLKEDYEKRLAKEKRYTLYTHPQARFLSVENIWNYFAPEMNESFKTLQNAQNGLDRDAFNSRVKLFLGEKQLPPSTLRQVFRYQEKQYDWLKPDEKFNQTDLSLFGYHMLEDWFGPYFTRLLSEFIINAAILAEEKGYDVSKAEVLADLVRHTQESYQQNLDNPSLGVTSAEEYMNEQLRRLNIDQTRAVKIWRQVLLFRRYFHDVGASVIVDQIASQNLHHFAQQNVTVDLYQLPSYLKLSNKDDLQRFEIYLYAATKQNKAEPLALPEHYLAVKEVAKSYPELVQKKYHLDVAQVNQKSLQARIGLRELWNWEVEDQNWVDLAKQFPILGKVGKSREERFEGLDNLDSTTRSLVDNYAKKSIVVAHPEWIDQALSDAKQEKMIVGLRTQGGKMPFSGLDTKKKRIAFIELLDQAVPGEKTSSRSPLYQYSSDQQSYYRITVLDRAPEPEILTFQEARNDGTLDEIAHRLLEKYYVTKRELKSSLYQKENQEWKPFKSVRDDVVNHFLEKVFQSLEPIQTNLFPEQDKNSWSKELAASLRFYPYMNLIKNELEKDPKKELGRWIKNENEASENKENLFLSSSPSLPEQWKVEKTTVVVDRQKQDSVNFEEAFALNPYAWSPLKTLPNGDVTFYQVVNKGESQMKPEDIVQQTKQAQILLGSEAQRQLMQHMIQELKSKNALSLTYLKSSLDQLEN